MTRPLRRPDRDRCGGDGSPACCRSSLSNFRLFQFTQVYIYAIALLGLNLLTGYNGQISLGHGAFYALGAYAAAIMMDQWQVPSASRSRRPA